MDPNQPDWTAWLQGSLLMVPWLEMELPVELGPFCTRGAPTTTTSLLQKLLVLGWAHSFLIS